MKPPASVLKAINTQINNELQAHYNYLGMSAHFERTPYLGFAKWMRAQSSEEYGHAMRSSTMTSRERNCKIELQAIEAPRDRCTVRGRSRFSRSPSPRSRESPSKSTTSTNWH